MTFATPIIAFAAIALTFSLGDFIALKTKGIVSSFIVAILIFITFGGVLKIFPPEMMDTSGLIAVIPTFGMALILTNLGSSLDLNELKSEWKTILIALAGVFGIVIVCFTAGQMIFGRVYALSAIAPIAGGIVAAMISTEAATAAGKVEIAAFIASILSIQKLVGLPIASYCLKKSADHYISAGKLERAAHSGGKKLSIRFIPELPKTLDTPAMHFARLALMAVLAQFLSKTTHLDGTLSYLLCGVLGSATGFLEKNCLKKAGGDGIVLLATYAYVSKAFLTITFSQFSHILIIVLGLLFLSAVGIAAISTVMGKVLGHDMYLSVATGLCCMFGYPVTYTTAIEVVNAAQMTHKLSDEDAARLTNYYLPKMIISGVTSVSIVSVIVANMIAPLIF
ncbi:MAG: hypothetical protein K0S22_1905 [Oscillospiraceae bacterium]|jgi:hypothetical protein|nr:hypothetical protein [Oscillospiraceae bacterium]